jgi:hypothetical protein
MRAHGPSVNDAAYTSTPQLSPQEPSSEFNEMNSDVLLSPGTSPQALSAPFAAGCIGATARVQALMRRFAHHAYTSYTQGRPRLSHLCLLTQYNLSTALQRNADILGVKAQYFECEGVSPFTEQESMAGLASPLFKEWPANLAPTQLQRSIEHHPWVDVFPWPRLRDNMLQAFEYPAICDEDEMCHDLVEYGDLDSKAFLVVWGDAWDFRNWEVTPEFLGRWGWLLSGCEDFLDSTNYWRAKRGEEPITQRHVLEAIRLSTPAKLL